MAEILRRFRHQKCKPGLADRVGSPLFDIYNTWLVPSPLLDVLTGTFFAQLAPIQAFTANLQPGRFRESELASESRTSRILPMFLSS